MTTIIHSVAATAPTPALDLYWQGGIDAGIDAAALVDTGLRVVRTTPAFDAIAQDGDGLVLAEGVAGARLRTGLADEQLRLDTAIVRATTRTTPVVAAMRCTRPSGRAPLVVVIHPLPWATRLLWMDDAAAVCTLVDPGQRIAAAPKLWREVFDLTRCEAMAAALLMAGHSVESAAAMRGCSPATLRVQLRRIFAKTGVSRQSDLIVLLARVG